MLPKKKDTTQSSMFFGLEDMLNQKHPHAGAGLRPVPFNLINNQNIYHPIFSSVIVSTTIHVVFGFKY